MSSCIKMLLEQCLARGELTLIVILSDTTCSLEGLSNSHVYLLRSISYFFAHWVPGNEDGGGGAALDNGNVARVTDLPP